MTPLVILAAAVLWLAVVYFFCHYRIWLPFYVLGAVGLAFPGAHAGGTRHFLPDRRGYLLGGADRPDPDTNSLGPEIQAGHMNTTLLAFFVYWGIWIVVPFLVDGLSALILFGGVVWARLRGRFQPYSGQFDFYPTLSVIIPALNGEHSLAACLHSIR